MGYVLLYRFKYSVIIIVFSTESSFHGSHRQSASLSQISIDTPSSYTTWIIRVFLRIIKEGADPILLPYRHTLAVSNPSNLLVRLQQSCQKIPLCLKGPRAGWRATWGKECLRVERGPGGTGQGEARHTLGSISKGRLLASTWEVGVGREDLMVAGSRLIPSLDDLPSLIFIV